MPVVGPLFRYELTRLARRGLQPKLRALFAGLLLGALFFTYLRVLPGVNPLRLLALAEPPLTIDQGARFGETFLVAFLVVQLVVVVVATPAVAGGAMAEEKERRSLDFLLCSPLTAREIVLGKMAARLAFVGAVVLTGLPVLTLTMFFGGVDGPRLLAGYAVTLLTMLSLGAYSLYLATITDSLGAVLLRAYGVTAGLTLFGFCCGCFVLPAMVSPFPAVVYLFEGPVWGGWRSADDPAVVAGLYAALHVPTAGFFLWRAAYAVRGPAPVANRPWPPRRERPAEPAAPPDHMVLPPTPADADHPRLVAWRWRSIPSLGDDEDPLDWKERWFGGRLWPGPETTAGGVVVTALVLVGIPLLWILLAASMSTLAQNRSLADVWGPAARIAAAILVPAILLGLGVIAAGSVARERQRQTLESLLSLPVEGRDILRAKARAAVRQVLPVLGLFAVCLAAGLVTGGVSLVALLTGPVLVVGWSAFGLGFGTWLSVRCPTPARATGYLLATVLALFFLPPLLSPVIGKSVAGQPGGRRLLTEAWVNGFSPLVGGWYALPDPKEYEQPSLAGAAGAAAGGVMAGVLGLAFWYAAVRRFESQTVLTASRLRGSVTSPPTPGAGRA